MDDLSFANHLKREAASDPYRRKGQRTRDALRLAAIEVLDEVGYHDMRLSDVCERGGVSPASFYQYFDDKREVTLSVVEEFVQFAYQRLFAPPDSSYRDAFAAIAYSNLRWLQVNRANPGLMRCILQLTDGEPEFARDFQRFSHKLHKAIAVGMLRRLNGAEKDLPAALFLAYALGSMMDEVARRAIIHPNISFLSTIEQVGDDEALAEALAVIWHRAIYGRNPNGARHPTSRRLIALVNAAPLATTDTQMPKRTRTGKTARAKKPKQPKSD